MSLRIVFMGTPDFAVPTLEALHAAGHDIVACYSQPPRPAGRRGLELVSSPVQRAAERLGIPVHTPTSLKEKREQNEFANLGSDVAVVVAYGMLLPAAILETPKFGCYNGHASLLPRWRGAAPIQRAIMAGDRQTGMSIMKMDEGLDTGDVALTRSVAIGESMTAGDLHDQLAEQGAQLMVRAMEMLKRGSLALQPQPADGVTYAPKISKNEARIDWALSAGQIHRTIMGLAPFPGAWFELPANKPVRVKVLASRAVTASGSSGTVLDEQLTIGCGEGAVRLLQLQKAGSRAMDVTEFLRGNPVAPGSLLT